jgi:CDGSH-type Zn-finger protein
MTQDEADLVIVVLEDGPYAVSGDVPVGRPDGETTAGPRYILCRCGGSSNKPFCVRTHASNGFKGTETADHGPIAIRRTSYFDDGVTVHDDGTVCAHVGQCTDRLARVFGGEPFVRVAKGTLQEIADVVPHCPSGALTYAFDASGEPIEEARTPGITALVNGPYAVAGRIEVRSADGSAYEVRDRCALCRCGGSANKPFCDGTHWRNGFQDG